jgi:hypothetical protein
MPGPVSGIYQGPGDNTPYVPTWLERDANANCPICSLLLDDDYCHQCERNTVDKHQ